MSSPPSAFTRVSSVNRTDNVFFGINQHSIIRPIPYPIGTPFPTFPINQQQLQSTTYISPPNNNLCFTQTVSTQFPSELQIQVELRPLSSCYMKISSPIVQSKIVS